METKTGKPKYQQIKDLLLGSIQSGALDDGACLPPERELCERYDERRHIRQGGGPQNGPRAAKLVRRKISRIFQRRKRARRSVEFDRQRNQLKHSRQ